MLVVEFSTVIENVTFPFVSLDWMASVKFTVPPVELFVKVLFRMVPVVFVISEPSQYYQNH